MNIPIPEGKIGVFKITGGGKKRYDGLDTPRVFCDDTEIPCDMIQDFSVFMDSENAKVTIRLCTFPAVTVEIDAEKIVIDGYEPISQREKRLEDSKREQERRKLERLASKQAAAPAAES